MSGFRLPALMVITVATLVVGLAAGDAAAKDRGTKLVRYFKVEVASTGSIGSDYVGNESAVHYRGHQLFGWGFRSREIYEYREFTGSMRADPSFAPACYGRKRSTCSPTKLKAIITENVDLVEDPNGDPTALTCSSMRTSPRPRGARRPVWVSGKRGGPVLRFGGEFTPIRPYLSANFLPLFPTTFYDPRCWKGIGHHWLSNLEHPTGEERAGQGHHCYPPEIGWSRANAGWLAHNADAFEQAFAPPLRNLAKRTSPFSVRHRCTVSRPLDHTTQGGAEHSTEWSMTWSVRFIPVKESKLRREIKALKKLR